MVPVPQLLPGPPVSLITLYTYPLHLIAAQLKDSSYGKVKKHHVTAVTRPPGRKREEETNKQ